MVMIVREMILLDRACFLPDDPHDFNDDSGWLGPPRAVPFAWELAPGTPKHERKADASNSTTTEEEHCRAIVKAGPGDEDPGCREEQQHHDSTHGILKNAPRSFLVSRNSTFSGELPTDRFQGQSVAFKWEMEPGIPRDPSKCWGILDCPLTPPPVFHSRSIVVHSSPRPTGKSTLSLSERLRRFLSIHPQRKQPQQLDFRMRLHPGQGRSPKSLLLKNSPSNSLSGKSGSAGAGAAGGKHSDEEDDLSPVSVLDYGSSVRSSGRPGDATVSSASSSRRSHYHTPQHSFSGDVAAASGSFKSARSSDAGSGPSRSGLSWLLMRRRHRNRAGCLTIPRSNSLTTTNDSFEEAVSEVNGSERSSSLGSDVSADKKPASSKDCGESSDEDARSMYYSPAPQIQSPRHSFSFPSRAAGLDGEADRKAEQEAGGRGVVDRVDSLETIDPGFAPSELGDESSQHNFTILNRMASCARWQRRQGPSIKQQRISSSNQLARSLFGRVTVCCYVPREDQC